MSDRFQGVITISRTAMKMGSLFPLFALHITSICGPIFASYPTEFQGVDQIYLWLVNGFLRNYDSRTSVRETLFLQKSTNLYRMKIKTSRTTDTSMSLFNLFSALQFEIRYFMQICGGPAAG